MEFEYYVICRDLRDVYTTPQSLDSAYQVKSINYAIALAKNRKPPSSIAGVQIRDHTQELVPFIELNSWRLSFREIITAGFCSLEFTIADRQTSRSLYTTWDGKGVSFAQSKFLQWSEYTSYEDLDLSNRAAQLEKEMQALSSENLELKGRIEELLLESKALKLSQSTQRELIEKLQEDNKRLKAKISRARKSLNSK